MYAFLNGVLATPYAMSKAGVEQLARAAARRLKSAAGYSYRMCRNIRELHNYDPPASEEEVRLAALQYVRKVSGSTKPSQANAEAFDRAVDEVAAATTRLLDSLVTTAPPKNREVEAAKRHARAIKRFAA